MINATFVGTLKRDIRVFGFEGVGWQKLELEQERALLAHYHPAIAQHDPLFSILFTLYVLPLYSSFYLQSSDAAPTLSYL